MKKIISLICAFTILHSLAAPQTAAAKMETAAKQVIVKDVETGQILFSKNHDTRMPTSSMSKVMTMYMVFDAIKKGQIKLDTTFTVSEKAWRKGGSKMFVEVGKKITVEDLIRGVIIQSGNDATIVLAEGLAETEDAFARRMTAKAKELGMKNSNFKNASGWPDPDHYSTAEDLAILAERVIKDFPEFYPYYSETEFEFNNIKQPNRNPLLYRDIGADGLKTGHTEVGGYGLIGTAKNDNRRVIMVVNGLDSTKQRADVSAQIMTWGLNGFENKTILNKGDVIATAEVTLGTAKSVPLVVNQDMRLTIPKEGRDNIKITADYNGPLKAPIKVGQEIGTLKIMLPNTNKAFETPLYAGADVEKLGFFKRAFTNAKLLIMKNI